MASTGGSGFQGLFSRFGLGFGRGAALDLAPDPQKEVGTSGAYVVGGFLVTQEKNPELTGRQRYRTFSDLLVNTAIVGAGTRGFLNLLSGADWSVVPKPMPTAREQLAADEAAQLVEDVIHGMDRPWSNVVRRAGMYRFLGFSVQEITFKPRKDGSIGLEDVAPRPQHTIYRWNLDPAGNVLGVTQRHPATFQEVYLPREKIVHVVDDALSDSPEGIGLFRHLVEPNQRLRRYQNLEAWGFETDLKGIPIARIPYGELNAQVKAGLLTRAERDAVVQKIEQFLTQHVKNADPMGIGLDSRPYRGMGEQQAVSPVLEWDIQLMQGSPTSAAEVAAAIERIVRDMAILLGVQGLLLGGDGSGSLALGRTFAAQFAQLVDSALSDLVAAFEHDLVPWILQLNGIDEDLAPNLRVEEVQHRDVEQVTESLRNLTEAVGPMPPDWDGVNDVLAMLGLPPIDLQATLLEPEDDVVIEQEPDEEPEDDLDVELDPEGGE